MRSAACAGHRAGGLPFRFETMHHSRRGRPLDKSEGVVKRYLSQAVREHRFFYQRG